MVNLGRMAGISDEGLYGEVESGDGWTDLVDVHE